MSNSTKGILIFLVIVLVLFGLWYLIAGKSQPAPVAPVVTKTVTTAPAPVQPPTPTDAVLARDNSNASLSADLSSVDAQLKVVDMNSGVVDQSLNDKPIAQTE